MADFAISQIAPDFVLVIRTPLFCIRFLQIWYQNKREMYLLPLMYFNCTILRSLWNILTLTSGKELFDEFIYSIVYNISPGVNYSIKKLIFFTSFTFRHKHKHKMSYTYMIKLLSLKLYVSIDIISVILFYIFCLPLVTKFSNTKVIYVCAVNLLIT